MGQPGPIPIFAISDLHLFLEGGAKGTLPSGLEYHAVPPGLIRNWQREVPDEACVLIPGDISDSSPQGRMHADYRIIDGLPGQNKILSPGNHERKPWQSQVSIERFCRDFPSLLPLASGGVTRLAASAEAPGLVVVAVQGACAPDDAWFGGEINLLGPDDPRKRFRNELAALANALSDAEEIAGPQDRLIVQIHYPPFVDFSRPGPFSERIEAAPSVDLCVYGHLHDQSEPGFEGERNGVNYRIVAGPRLGMHPLRLGELTEKGVRWTLDASGN